MIFSFNVFNKEFFIDDKTGDFDNDFLKLAFRNLNQEKVEYYISLENYNPSFATFCINISNACNLKCDYCFNQNKNGTSLKFEDIKDYLDLCFESFPNKDKYFIDLSGKGEPLLFLSLIFKIKEYCDTISNKLQREVLVSFVTNGVLLTKNLANSLQDKGILFGVSIDGNREIHNKHRKDTSNGETYDLVINNVKNIDNKEFIGAAVTLTKDVFSLIDSIKELILTFKTISYKPVRKCELSFDKGITKLWLKEYEKLTLFLIHEIKKGNFIYIFSLLNGDDYFAKFIKRIFLKQIYINRCDAGINRFSLNEDKNIYICSVASDYLDYYLGKGKIDLEKRNSIYSLQLENPICNKCPYRLICGGECLIERKLNNGNNEAICIFKKGLINLAIYFYYEIKNYNIESFKKIIEFINNVNKRYIKDDKLLKYINDNHYSFVEGKKIYDKIL